MLENNNLPAGDSSSEARHRILANLISASRDLEDALQKATPGARYDPVIVSQIMREKLSLLRDDLLRIIAKLKESS